MYYHSLNSNQLPLSVIFFPGIAIMAGIAGIVAGIMDYIAGRGKRVGCGDIKASTGMS